MPRANRHFLPGYLWHISNGVASSNRSNRSIAMLRSSGQRPGRGSKVQGVQEFKVGQAAVQSSNVKKFKVTETWGSRQRNSY